jgi:plasmid stabilization system protein ParE
VRGAAAEEGISVSTWLAAAAAAKARRRHLRTALDELAEDQGAMTDDDIDRLIAESRKRSIVTQPRRGAA